MKPTNCTRYTFDLGARTLKYGALRHYVCNECGGAVTHRSRWDEELDKSVDEVKCAKCGGEDIIHESKYLQQISDAMEYKYTHKEADMPLNDVIQQEQDTGRLTVLGRIRLGWQEPNQSGRGEHAVASDHFVFTDVPFLEEKFGNDCKSLNIRFPFVDFDRNIAAFHRVWAGGARKGSGICLCQGDGVRVFSALPFKVTHKQNGGVSVRRAPGDRLVSYGKAAVDFTWGDRNVQVGEEVPCPGRRHDLYPHCEVCRPSILLNIEIDGVDRFGYWQVGTQSINNYKHFLATWDKLTKRPDGSRIPLPMNEVPFVLSIKPGSTLYQNQKDKMWASREAFYLHLQLDPSVVSLLNEYRTRRFVALLQGRPTEMLRLRAADGGVSYMDDRLPSDDEPIDGDYDSELVEDDPFLNDEPEPEPEPAEPEEPVENVPAPNNLSHKNIVKLAAQHLSFRNQGEVKGAMFAIIQDTYWYKSTEWSPKDVWVQLQDHLRAPGEEG